ncbi:MAG: F0F1 ATP synthase subunit B [Bacteroidales bacterium]
MELVTPGLGLLFWTCLIFLILFFLLKKFAFPSIVKILEEREDGIENALLQAEIARKSLEELNAKNEVLLKEAKEERDILLREAHNLHLRMLEEAKEKSKADYDALMLNAREDILLEKQAAIADIKNEVSAMALDMSKKILEANFEDSKNQQEYADRLLSKIHLNP